jgi:hypothetical protein
MPLTVGISFYMPSGTYTTSTQVPMQSLPCSISLHYRHFFRHDMKYFSVRGLQGEGKTRFNCKKLLRRRALI